MSTLKLFRVFALSLLGIHGPLNRYVQKIERVAKGERDA